MLEDTVEEMSTTFVGLSASVLESEHIRSHPQLITSIGESVKRALTLAENATRNTDEGAAGTDNDSERPQGQSHAPVQSERASTVLVASTQGEPSTAARFLTMNEMGMQDFYMDPPFEAVPSTEAVARPGNAVPQIIRGMLTQNTFFTKEFWGGDYTTTADKHMVGRPTRPLPFWERLLRLNLTTVIHRLTCDGVRGDANLCARWEANGFKYSLRHKSKANVLARTRWVIDSIAESDARADVMATNMLGPTPMQADWRPHIETYFDNDDLRAFGAATMHSMVLAGFPVQSLVNAEEVETYLKDKGMVEADENEMQMELIIPATSSQAIEVNGSLHTRMTGVAPREHKLPPTASRYRKPLSRQNRPRKRLVTVSVDSLIEKFIDMSICTGNGIGYPKPGMNAAIVASVVRIGD